MARRHLIPICRHAAALAVIGLCTAPLAAACTSPGAQPAAAHHDATRAAPTVTITQTITATPPPGPRASAAAAATTTPPTKTASSPARPAPQGSVALGEWHDGDATNKCVNVMTHYENRSDTAVISITQTLQTNYTPKHSKDEYPDSVDGPLKTLTQDAGIEPYGERTLYWQVCAPELASKQNPVPADGTDSFMSEIGAQPRTTTWHWAK
ncbi:hypothetical protein [Streptomyces sp. NPDC048527]|uniref:hypothetical protein n=1 Tax=Streptomyces sp. NPDC048527 TaxID=3365568 RepID=UPI00371F7C2F